MRIHAYVLAADPTWLRSSVRAYYPHVEKLVVSYDVDSRGWTGAPVRVDECSAILSSLDVENKIEWAPGSFQASAPGDYLAAETQQRRVALAQAGAGADWVLQIDTDEILPDWTQLLKALDAAAALELPAVEWPMRVLFRRLRSGQYLEFGTSEGKIQFTYPGAIAVRPDIELTDCRRANSPYLRPVVQGDRFSLQVERPPESGEHRVTLPFANDAIWHNSWARSPSAVREKIASWGHNEGVRTWMYYYMKWLPAPVTWRFIRQAHLLNTLPSRLRLSSDLPTWINE